MLLRFYEDLVKCHFAETAPDDERALQRMRATSKPSRTEPSKTKESCNLNSQSYLSYAQRISQRLKFPLIPFTHGLGCNMVQWCNGSQDSWRSRSHSKLDLAPVLCRDCSTQGMFLKYFFHFIMENPMKMDDDHGWWLGDFHGFPPFDEIPRWAIYLWIIQADPLIMQNRHTQWLGNWVNTNTGWFCCW